MKVQLVVVQGKPEGKIIPLLGPVFKIGRGENCHLRPNSEMVSREHAEFTIGADSVSVKDLGSRNGTLVNGKAVAESCPLKDRDLVQVGNLTFAVSIQGAPAVTAKSPTVEGDIASKAKSAPGTAPTAAKKPSGSGGEDDMIESWLVADGGKPTPDRASGVYGGETVSISTVKTPAAGAKTPAATKPATPALAPAAPNAATPALAPAAPTAAAPAPTPAPAPAATKPTAPASAPASAEEYDEVYEQLPEGTGDPENEHDASNDTVDGEMIPEEFIDESNPFFVKKTAADSKPAYKDTSDAASDILKKMMERRRKPT